MTTEKKNFKAAASELSQQKIDDHVVDFEEVRKYMQNQFGVDIGDVDTRIKLRKLTKPEKEKIKESKEAHSWAKPFSTTAVNSETSEHYHRRMSQGDKGFFAGLATAAGIWILSKVGEQTKAKEPQLLSAEEEFQIVERRLMRDNYLRYLNRE